MRAKQYFTELVFILDCSGSMGGLESDTIGGFNSMLTMMDSIAILRKVLENKDIGVGGRTILDTRLSVVMLCLLAYQETRKAIYPTRKRGI